jgi:hypothetical protein
LGLGRRCDGCTTGQETQPHIWLVREHEPKVLYDDLLARVVWSANGKRTISLARSAANEPQVMTQGLLCELLWAVFEAGAAEAGGPFAEAAEG